MLRREDNELLVRVGPGTPMGSYLRRFWLPAMMLSELPKPDCDPVRLRILGEDLVAFRDTDGKIGVLHERCPHRRASLFYGRNEQHGLRCVYHGWKFDTEGRCVEQPSEPPDSSFKEKVRQVAYPACEWGGLIWIYMGDRATRPDLPQFEWATLPAERRWQAKWLYEANFAQGIEGELDSAHTGFLHDTKTPHSEMAAAMAQASTYWAGDKAPALSVTSTDYGFYYGSRRRYGDDQFYWRITQWLLPFFAIIPMPKWPISCRAYVPVDDNTTLVFNTTYNADAPLSTDDLTTLEAGLGPAPELIPGTFRPKLNASNDYGLDRDVQRTRNFTGIYGINNQDRAVVESMGAICDRWNEHLGTSDIAVIAMRKRLLEEVRKLQRGETAMDIDGSMYTVRPLDIIASASELDALVETFSTKLRADAMSSCSSC